MQCPGMEIGSAPAMLPRARRSMSGDIIAEASSGPRPPWREQRGLEGGGGGELSENVSGYPVEHSHPPRATGLQPLKTT